MFFLALKILHKNKLWLLYGLTISLVCGTAFLSFLFGGRQPLTTAMDVGISTIRLTIPLLTAFWAQDVIYRDFERKYSHVTLAYPTSRFAWLFGRFGAILANIGLCLLASTASLAATLFLLSSQVHQDTPISLGSELWVTTAFTFMDLLLLASLATLLAVSAATPSFIVIGTLGFMLITRSYATVAELLRSEAGLVSAQESYESGLVSLNLFFPDLASMDIRAIALYSDFGFMPNDWPASVSASAVYAVAILATSYAVIRKKQIG